MSTPANTTIEELLGGTVRMTVLSAEEVVIVTEDDIMINRIPVEFRAYFKKNSAGSWYSSSMTTYRNDNPFPWPRKAATSNQTRKIYRACSDLADALTTRALYRGERIKTERQIQAVHDSISMKEEELAALENLHHALLVEEENAS